MSEKININAGNKAKKKLKAMDAALFKISPFIMLLKKKRST